MAGLIKLSPEAPTRARITELLGQIFFAEPTVAQMAALRPAAPKRSKVSNVEVAIEILNCIKRRTHLSARELQRLAYQSRFGKTRFYRVLAKLVSVGLVDRVEKSYRLSNRFETHLRELADLYVKWKWKEVGEQGGKKGRR